MQNNEYTVFNKVTGKVVKYLGCSLHQAKLNFDPVTEILCDQWYVENCIINHETLVVKETKIPYPEFPVTNLFSLKQYVDSEDNFNKAIINLGEEPVAFKKKYYTTFRKWLYPDSNDYLDIQFKLRSDDPKERKKSKEQLKAYDAVCRSAKNRFPKE
jgi:hypothetical protein